MLERRSATHYLKTPLVPAGILNQYTKDGLVTNIGASVDTIHEKVERLNDPGFILPEFFTVGRRPNDSIGHHVLTFRSGAMLGIKQNSSPYGIVDEGFSVVASGFGDRPLRRFPNGEIIPQTILDIEEDARRGFSDATTAAFVELEAKKKPGEKVFYTQGQAAVLQPRSAQSGHWVHGHVFSLVPDRIIPGEENLPMHKIMTALAGDRWDSETARLSERGTLIASNETFTNNALRRGAKALESDLQANNVDLGDISLGYREAAPLGFSFLFDGEVDAITAANATQEANLKRIYDLRCSVTRVYPDVADHYANLFARRPGAFAQAYGEEYGVDQLPLTHPHSHLEIMDLTEDGFLRLSVIPMFRLGPIEVLNVLYQRTSDKTLAQPHPEDFELRHVELGAAGFAQIAQNPDVIETSSYNPITDAFHSTRSN